MSKLGRDELIGSAEAAEILHIDRRTLGRWGERGLIRPARRLPGRTGVKLYSRAKVERLAAELSTQRAGDAA